MLWCDARGTFAFVFAAVASWVCRVAHLLRIDKGGGRGLNRASGQKLSWPRLLVRARLALPVDRQFASQVYTAVDSSVAVPLCSSCKRVTCLAFIDINVVVCRSPADLVPLCYSFSSFRFVCWYARWIGLLNSCNLRSNKVRCGSGKTLRYQRSFADAFGMTCRNRISFRFEVTSSVWSDFVSLLMLAHATMNDWALWKRFDSRTIALWTTANQLFIK